MIHHTHTSQVIFPLQQRLPACATIFFMLHTRVLISFSFFIKFSGTMAPCKAHSSAHTYTTYRTRQQKQLDEIFKMIFQKASVYEDFFFGEGQLFHFSFHFFFLYSSNFLRIFCNFSTKFLLRNVTKINKYKALSLDK